MVRRNFLAITIIFISGCYLDLPEIPIKYYISSSCLPRNKDKPELAALKRDEALAIIKGAEELNKATCKEFFHYVGIYYDDRFTIREDLQDGKLVVYCVQNRENPDANEILIPTENYLDIIAYSIADILVSRKGVEYLAEFRYKKIDHHSEDEPVPRDYYLKVFKMIVTHEFMHRLIWSHNHDALGYSLMNSIASSPFAAYTPTRLDIEGSEKVDGICDIYDCPPADTCPTRPAF